MAEKDDMKLEIEEEGSEESQEAPAAASAAEDVPEPQAEPIAPARSGSTTRLLLLVLLLAVLGAAAWFLYFAPQTETAPTAAAPAAPKQQAVPVPARDQAPPAQPPAQPPVQAVATPEKPAADPSAVSASASGKTAGAAGASSGKPVSEPAESAPAEDGEKTPAGETAPPAKPVPARPAAVANGPQAPEKDIPSQEIPILPISSPADEKTAVSAKAPKSASGTARGGYQIQVGAYAVAANLAEAQDKVQSLGFEPHVKESRRTTHMVRLRVGTFFPSQGEAKIAEVAAAGGEPFFIKDRDLMVVYAGSFQSPERARQLTERLREKGVHAEAETVPTQVPLSILRFGNFGTRSEAEAAAVQARAAGLDALIVKTR